jgi:hypothetical protein
MLDPALWRVDKYMFLHQPIWMLEELVRTRHQTY